MKGKHKDTSTHPEITPSIQISEALLRRRQPDRAPFLRVAIRSPIDGLRPIQLLVLAPEAEAQNKYMRTENPRMEISAAKGFI